VTYALDRLGWLHFEQLCAALLELEGGVAPLAWAGGADRCRSVLSGTPLGPPLVTAATPEPVLIQCAWLRDDTPDGLIGAVARLIAERPDDLALARSLVVLTNGRRSAKLATTIKRSLPDQRVKVRVLGRTAIGKRLDARAELRRAMPSALGVRDLSELIAPEVAARSSLDRAAASKLATVFMPTRAYRRALGVLDRHRFAVLTGPPEMGKTAIARTIALAQLTDGWEAHECTRPDDIWGAFDASRAQVFIADDAFGSTEYRPDAAERWAREMERILRTLDDRHWLIWTSRPAPLRAGLGRLHRERGAERFPSPGEVLVDASKLDVAEKTLILFRHAKAAELPPETRAWLKHAGAEIVAHPHFTPERIRRFVARLAVIPAQAITVPGIVRRELTDPTDAMTASFSSLGAEHRDLLIAMLDTPPGPVSERDLTDALRRHHDGALPQAPAALVDRLTDHFLRSAGTRVEWVHPSWRDLVIDHLAEDAMARAHFLSGCSPHGVLLALSLGGGDRGSRELPLLISDPDWDALTDRIYELAPELDTRELYALLDSIGSAVALRDERSGEAKALARTVLARLAHLWEHAEAPIPLQALEAWLALARRVRPGSRAPTPPNLERTWAELLPATAPDVEDLQAVERFADWLTLADLLRVYRPKDLERFRFGDQASVINIFVDSLDGAPWGLDPGARDHVLRALRQIELLAPALESMSPYFWSQLDGAVLEFLELQHERSPRPSPEPLAGQQPGWRLFDVARVLEDL
jgi:hypothetical protein